MKKNVTAKDIAKKCGVSQATVSYVINNRENQKISGETREKILRAIEELHYFPNISARNMRKRNCASVGIVCARDYSRQAFLNSMVGISSYFDKINYTITIFNEEDCETPQYVKSYFSNIIDGLIYISNNDHDDFIKPAIENNIPYVVICMDGVFSARSPAPHGFDHVLTECAQFCRDNHLRKIRYFSVNNDGLFVNNKYPVFQRAVKDVYPECDIDHVVCHVTHREHGRLVPFLEEYMADNTFDIAISQNYDIGLILQRQILGREFSIPQKIKNIFLNYVDFYEITYPSVTGIYIPYTEMGTYAAKMVMSIIEGEEEDFEYQELECRLIHRESTLI